MTWLRVDDSMLDHPKFVRAVRAGGSAAIHLWLAMATWCARHLSDGRIPSDMIATVGGPKRDMKRALHALETSGLCQRSVEGDIVLHDFTRYNPTREQIKHERERKAINQKNHRDRMNVTGNGNRPVTDSEVSARPDPVPSSPAQLECLSSPAPPAPDALPVVRDVFSEWQRVHGHPKADFDAKRIARIRRALKHRGPDELKQAIRGALKDDWLMGRDPKSPRKYDGLETILRDSAQIERLIDLETGKTKTGVYRPQVAGASKQLDHGVDPMKFFKGVKA